MGTESNLDFFISRQGNAFDIDIADRINAILKNAGYSTFLESENFGHTSFMASMQSAFDSVDKQACVIAILSEAYMQSDHCQTECYYALIDDPQNKKEKLIVLRVKECNPSGFLKPIPYVDLVPVLDDEESLREAVLYAVGSGDTNKPEWLKVVDRRQELTPVVISPPDKQAVLYDVLGITEIARHFAKPVTQLINAIERGIGEIGKPVISIANAKTQRIVSKERARTVGEVTGKFVSILQDTPETHKQLVEQLFRRVVFEDLERQQNREAVSHHALEYFRNEHEDLAKHFDPENPEAIDKDWLTMFWNCAENKSNEDMQSLFGRILSQECFSPGIVSPYALHVISVLDFHGAKAFERLCNISLQFEDDTRAFIMEAPGDVWDQPEDAPELDKFGVTLEDFQIVEQFGLLSRTITLAFTDEDDGGIICAGDLRLKLSIKSHEHLEQLVCYQFTSVGEQLRQILKIDFKEDYLDVLKVFLETREIFLDREE